MFLRNYSSQLYIVFILNIANTARKDLPESNVNHSFIDTELNKNDKCSVLDIFEENYNYKNKRNLSSNNEENVIINLCDLYQRFVQNDPSDSAQTQNTCINLYSSNYDSNNPVLQTFSGTLIALTVYNNKTYFLATDYYANVIKEMQSGLQQAVPTSIGNLTNTIWNNQTRANRLFTSIYNYSPEDISCPTRYPYTLLMGKFSYLDYSNTSILNIPVCEAIFSSPINSPQFVVPALQCNDNNQNMLGVNNTVLSRYQSKSLSFENSLRTILNNSTLYNSLTSSVAYDQGFLSPQTLQPCDDNNCSIAYWSSSNLLSSYPGSSFYNNWWYQGNKYVVQMPLSCDTSYLINYWGSNSSYENLSFNKSYIISGNGMSSCLMTSLCTGCFQLGEQGIWNSWNFQLRDFRDYTEFFCGPDNICLGSTKNFIQCSKRTCNICNGCSAVNINNDNSKKTTLCGEGTPYCSNNTGSDCVSSHICDFYEKAPQCLNCQGTDGFGISISTDACGVRRPYCNGNVVQINNNWFCQSNSIEGMGCRASDSSLVSNNTICFADGIRYNSLNTNDYFSSSTGLYNSPFSDKSSSNCLEYCCGIPKPITNSIGLTYNNCEAYCSDSTFAESIGLSCNGCSDSYKTEQCIEASQVCGKTSEGSDRYCCGTMLDANGNKVSSLKDALQCSVRNCSNCSACTSSPISSNAQKMASICGDLTPYCNNPIEGSGDCISQHVCDIYPNLAQCRGCTSDSSNPQALMYSDICGYKKPYCNNVSTVQGQMVCLSDSNNMLGCRNPNSSIYNNRTLCKEDGAGQFLNSSPYTLWNLTSYFEHQVCLYKCCGIPSNNQQIALGHNISPNYVSPNYFSCAPYSTNSTLSRELGLQFNGCSSEQNSRSCISAPSVCGLNKNSSPKFCCGTLRDSQGQIVSDISNALQCTTFDEQDFTGCRNQSLSNNCFNSISGCPQASLGNICCGIGVDNTGNFTMDPIRSVKCINFCETIESRYYSHTNQLAQCGGCDNSTTSIRCIDANKKNTYYNGVCGNNCCYGVPSTNGVLNIIDPLECQSSICSRFNCTGCMNDNLANSDLCTEDYSICPVGQKCCGNADVGSNSAEACVAAKCSLNQGSCVGCVSSNNASMSFCYTSTSCGVQKKCCGAVVSSSCYESCYNTPDNCYGCLPSSNSFGIDIPRICGNVNTKCAGQLVNQHGIISQTIQDGYYCREKCFSTINATGTLCLYKDFVSYYNLQSICKTRPFLCGKNYLYCGDENSNNCQNLNNIDNNLCSTIPGLRCKINTAACPVYSPYCCGIIENNKCIPGKLNYSVKITEGINIGIVFLVPITMAMIIIPLLLEKNNPKRKAENVFFPLKLIGEISVVLLLLTSIMGVVFTFLNK